jgi:nucleotide-binding universal stress UspA family protein
MVTIGLGDCSWRYPPEGATDKGQTVPFQIQRVPSISQAEKTPMIYWVLQRVLSGTQAAWLMGMKKQKSNLNVIWACDPFENAGKTQSTVMEALSLLNEKVQIAVQPVYVLSPGTIGLQHGASRPQIGQYEPVIGRMLKRSLKDFRIGKAVAPHVVVQRSESLRSTVKSLLIYARAGKADLIVVGTRANRGVSRFLLGSFTETLILNAKVPVLTVSPGAKSRPLRRILFPTDLGTGSRLFFKKVCELAKGLDAEVTLLHVLPHPVAPVLQSGVYLIGGGWIGVPQFVKAAEERALRLMNRWKVEAASVGVVVTPLVEQGGEGARKAILGRAQAKDIGLVAIGAQSGVLGATLIGSLVRQVVREAPCPVWVLRK